MGLTFLRLLLLPVFLGTLLVDSRTPGRLYHWVPVGIFALMAITDKLDGYLARRLKQTSRLGAILDPVADKLLIACAVILLSFDWIAPSHFQIPLWVVLAVYGKDLITAIGAVALLALVGKVTIMPRPLGKASTLLQLSMVLAVLLAPEQTAGWHRPWLLFVRGLWWTVTVVAVLSCVDYVIQGIGQFAQGRRAMGAAGADSSSPPG